MSRIRRKTKAQCLQTFLCQNPDCIYWIAMRLTAWIAVYLQLLRLENGFKITKGKKKYYTHQNQIDGYLNRQYRTNPICCKVEQQSPDKDRQKSQLRFFIYSYCAWRTGFPSIFSCGRRVMERYFCTLIQDVWGGRCAIMAQGHWLWQFPVRSISPWCPHHDLFQHQLNHQKIHQGNRCSQHHTQGERIMFLKKRIKLISIPLLFCLLACYSESYLIGTGEKKNSFLVRYRSKRGYLHISWFFPLIHARHKKGNSTKK